MYIQSLSIKNLRCFRDASLELQYPGKASPSSLQHPNINLLIGNNGAGKSTVLRALALATLAPIMRGAGFVPYRLVRRTRTEKPSEAQVSAEVLLHAQDLPKRKAVAPRTAHASLGIFRRGDYEELYLPDAGSAHPAQVSEEWAGMFDDRSPAFLVVGYGATRRVEHMRNYDESARRKARLLRYERVAGLFESHIALTPLAAWLPQFKSRNPGRHKQVVNLINRLLPEGAAFAGQFAEGEYFFEMHGEPIPFGALSDGYRAYIGWVADLLYHVCMGAPSGAKLVENRGLVLVDEIDLHLHPEWQRSIIARLSATLPNLQFVFSTHSPLVASSLQPENIFVMDPTGDGAAVVKQYQENIYGLTSEQVLQSSYFNLPTTRAKTVERHLRTLSTQAGEGDLKAALSFMRALSGQNGAAPAASETTEDAPASTTEVKPTAKQRQLRQTAKAKPKPKPKR